MSREIGGVRIAAIGPATAARVREFHLNVDLQPEEFVAEASHRRRFKKDSSIENLRILLARAEQARDVLPKELTRLGAIVDEAIAYRTVPETEDASGALARFREEGADLITFTSSSTVENFLALKLPFPAGVEDRVDRADHLQNDARPWLARRRRGGAVRYPGIACGDRQIVRCRRCVKASQSAQTGNVFVGWQAIR